MNSKTWIVGGFALALATACGDDGGSPSDDTTATGSATTGPTTSATNTNTDPTTNPSTGGPDDTTGDGPGQTDSTTGEPATDSGAATDSGSDSGGATDSGSGSDSGGMMAVHGCDGPDSATDMTGMAMVELTWELVHQQCILVDAGTTVRWDGDLRAHPLVGGVTPTADAASPITQAGGVAGMMVDVTFPAAGEYPYFCGLHLAAMQGVVYVQ